MHDQPFRISLRLAALIVVVAAALTVVAHPGSGIVVDRSGRVHFTDTGGGVWRIETNGRLVHQGGPRFHWMTIDESDRPSGARTPSIPGGEITAIGNHPTLLVSSDVPIAMGRDGVLYYPEYGRETGLRIMRITRAGVRTAWAALPARSKSPPLRWINGLAAGSDGAVYYTEDQAVRKIDRRGAVSTLVENVAVRNCAAIPGTEAGSEPYLRGLAVAADGTVFVAASGCGAVLKISPRGELTTLLRTTRPWSPTAVALSSSGVYVLEYIHTDVEDRLQWIPRVRKVLPNGRIVDVAAVQRNAR